MIDNDGPNNLDRINDALFVVFETIIISLYLSVFREEEFERTKMKNKEFLDPVREKVIDI
ncbi:MAG: hypothetical protein ACOC87_02475 [Candidatus Natronoplasma sp.]